MSLGGGEEMLSKPVARGEGCGLAGISLDIQNTRHGGFSSHMSNTPLDGDRQLSLSFSCGFPYHFPNIIVPFPDKCFTSRFFHLS